MDEQSEHEHETVEIIGTDGRPHLVPAERVDRHFHGSDGRLVTDEEWDEMKRREANPIEFDASQFAVSSGVTP